MDNKDFKTVSIPTTLYKKIEEQIEGTEFSSVEDYIIFVLEEILKEDEDSESALSPEEEELVKERLKGLGYL